MKYSIEFNEKTEEALKDLQRWTGLDLGGVLRRCIARLHIIESVRAERPTGPVDVDALPVKIALVDRKNRVRVVLVED